MDTNLINKSQVKRALKVKGVAGDLLSGAAMRMAGLHQINELHRKVHAYQGLEFAQKLLEEMKITCAADAAELEYIPKEGPCIVVSNHPFGGIDGIAMLAVLGRIRPDIKVLVNFLLSYIPNLEALFLPVNPFTDRPGMRSSLKGLRMAKEHLAAGGVLGLFPAGQVSSYDNPDGVIRDIEWQKSIVKLIREYNVPVVPLYFHGTNSRLFHFLGRIHPMLRTARLPRELLNKRGMELQMRIGRSIAPSEIAEFDSLESLAGYLWNRSFSLEGNIPDSSVPARKESVYTVPIGRFKDPAVLAAEIGDNARNRLFAIGNYECYLCRREEIPQIVEEIGLRREEAFRAAGEGTNTASDLDRYDDYYRHLVLWNRTDGRVAGAYRLGFGNEIMPEYGLKGFYTHTLFHYKEGFSAYLQQAIELGRSFVCLEYQKDPLALMLLIKGLMYTVVRHPQIRYFLGPVSISSWYPLFYRSLMIYYLRERHSLKDLEGLVAPGHPFRPDYKRIDPGILLSHKMDSVEKFDKFIFRLSDGRYKLPTLLKKYVKINARIISYNVDPDFNYCVDGLIMVDVLETPKGEIDALSKEFEDKDMIYRRFGLE